MSIPGHIEKIWEMKIWSMMDTKFLSICKSRWKRKSAPPFGKNISSKSESKFVKSAWSTSFKSWSFPNERLKWTTTALKKWCDLITYSTNWLMTVSRTYSQYPMLWFQRLILMILCINFDRHLCICLGSDKTVYTNK